jgi:hypothetical protein
MTTARAFRGFRFPAEVILWAVRWYLQFRLGWRKGAKIPVNPFRDEIGAIGALSPPPLEQLSPILA